ncbi:trehalase family glycosidase [Ascidiimonas sp. W6]|uniref:trehalase family glycosidase n=1 Tax=Ascidiimonas meishanensis TaxID=3128903 RepID=UPI0030EF1D8C
MLFKLNIEKTLHKLLEQEDTDGDKKITKEDKGPRSFELITVDGLPYEVKGTYYLSNLLQELALARANGDTEVKVSLRKIEEPPASRISRMIRYYFWNDLTRTVDKEGLKKILSDDKADDTSQRIYVPSSDTEGVNYFEWLASEYPNLIVEILPEKITPAYVKSINDKPGILSLKIVNDKGIPFVVPGGRFNEMYGWDSYFEGVGLLLDDRKDLAKAMVDNFCYQITHYGKILNANRSYYLTRTQPPFLSSFILEVFEAGNSISLEWLKETMSVAIHEYETVWMEQSKRLCDNGLNRYLAEGIGIPPETEKGHFDEILSEFAMKAEMPKEEFEAKYISGEIKSEALDEYFIHDRSLRESGHDTSWRLDNVCADLNTVDLNSLLYKYEEDFGYLIKKYFDGEFQSINGKIYTHDYWKEKAKFRKQKVDSLLWDANHGGYFDYNFVMQKQTYFESATNFYPLWAKMCSEDQAALLVKNLMRDFKAKGGVLATTHASIKEIGKGKASRQWDYPNGWAPHQMLIWKGLLNYGYKKEAQELIYRWLWMITRNAVDYNGTIPEKYDVVKCTHKVYAEYGNVGTQFDYITTSGFGWMNASYQLGLHLLKDSLLEKLNQLKDPDNLFNS